MGSPVLNAVASGVPIVTPYGALNPDVYDEDFPWEETGLTDEEIEEVQRTINIEVRYETQ